jgi:hypothetical protein
MNENGHDQNMEQEKQEHPLTKSSQRDAGNNHPPTCAPLSQARGVHYTELPPAKPDEVFYQEWNTYRHEVGRLLAEGLQGRFVLIDGTEIVGIFETWEAARAIALTRSPSAPSFVHAIRAVEPYLRIRGINSSWGNFVSQ